MHTVCQYINHRPPKWIFYHYKLWDKSIICWYLILVLLIHATSNKDCSTLFCLWAEYLGEKSKVSLVKKWAHIYKYQSISMALHDKKSAHLTEITQPNSTSHYTMDSADI